MAHAPTSVAIAIYIGLPVNSSHGQVITWSSLTLTL